MYKPLRLLLLLMLGVNLSASAQTFFYTGGPQYYTVPAGVTQISVTLQGATGGQNSDEISYPDRAGYGGCVTALIAVSPGQVLNVNVGGVGGAGTPAAGGTGGWNGGGAGSNGLGAFSGGGGGGRSDLSFLGTVLVAAGGGGGAGEDCATVDADRGGDGGAPAPGGVSVGGEQGAGCGTATGGCGGVYNNTSTACGGSCGGCLGLPGGTGNSTSGGGGGINSAGGGGGGGYGGGGGGQWSGGGGGSDYYGGPGVYFVAESRGCNSSGNGVVTIAVSCIPGGIQAGADSICVGSTATFIDTIPGGTWISSNPLIATVGSTTGVVTGVSSGVFTLTYELTAGTPGCRATRQVTINPLPAAVSGPPSMCQNATFTFTDATPSGAWSSSDITVATVGSAGLVTAVASGFANIVYTLPTGCASSSPLIVNPVPDSIVGPDSVCLGSSIILSDPTAGASWSVTPITGLATGTLVGLNLSVTGTGVGTVLVRYYYPLTSCAATMVVTVNPLPSAIVGSNKVCMGSTITLTDPTPLGTWSSSVLTVATIGSTSGIVTPVSAPGTTSICYTLPTGCKTCTTVSTNPVPNPISGPSVMCDRATITLTDLPTSGNWTSSNTLIATATPGPSTASTITGAGGGGGVVNITFTIPATGCYAIHPVTVNPLPVITGPTDLCVGNTTTYTGSPSGGTWAMVSGPGTIVGGTGFFTAGPGSGTAVIRYTAPTTLCISQYTVNVHPNPVITGGPTQVCIGATVSLSATSGGTWSSPDDPTLVTGVSGTASPITVTGVASGVASITYTFPTTCFATTTVTVYPNPSPIVGTVTQLCNGDSTLLTDPDPGGTWSSNLPTVAAVGSSTGMVTAVGTTGGVVTISYTYPSGCYATYTLTVVANPSPFAPVMDECISGPPVTLTTSGGAGTWTSKDNSVATITPITGIVSPVSVGVDSICYTFTAAPNCFLCEQFTVNPVPQNITGPTKVCTGQTITMSDLTTGGTWSLTDNIRANISVGGVVTGMAAGLDTVVYTLGTGCYVLYPITVNASPAAIGYTSLNVCAGQSLTLTETTFGGAWSRINGTGSVSITPAGLSCTVTGVTAGTATVYYTIPNGCAASVVVTVTVLSTPITGPGMVCTGSTITLNDASPGPGTWTSGTGAVASVTSPGNSTTVTGISPGTSVITYSYLGCQTNVTVTVNLTPAALITPIGTTDLCPGGTAVLTATTGVGYTYTWLDPGVIPGATGPTYSTSTAATYSVTVSTAFCSATSPGVTVTMNPVLATIAVTGALTTCASTPPTLTASPGAGVTYQWESSGVPITGATAAVFTPTVSGTYDVVATNAFGCSGTATAVTVTLIPSPSATVTLSGPLTFCAGDSVVMTVAPVAGDTYQWFLAGAPIPGATNSSYTALLAGNYYVTVTNSIGCNATSTTMAVTVTPGPPSSFTVSGGSTIFCTGGGVSLVAPSVPTFGYLWYRNGVVIPGATGSTYFATTSGTYSVLTTDITTGCSTMSTSTTVTEVATPIIQPMSATVFCWGGSVTLNAAITPGAGIITYQWFRNGTPIPGGTGSSYVATITGLYTVAITVTAASPACTLTSTAVSVIENPLPNPLVTFDGTYFHTQTYFVTYQWYKNLLPISGATTSMVHNSGAGTYKVDVTDTNGCQSMSANYTIGTSGVNTVNTNTEIRIYPNPAQTVLHIDADLELHATVSGIDGRTLIEQADAKDIDVTHLADGVYFIKLFDEYGILQKTEKFVKASK